MTAAALGANAQVPIHGSNAARQYPLGEAGHRETSRPPAARTRAAVFGLALGALTLVPVVVGGLLIASGPFHTSLGSLV